MTGWRAARAEPALTAVLVPLVLPDVGDLRGPLPEARLAA